MTGRDDFGDKGRPVMRPFLLEDGHQNEVEFIEESSLALELLFGLGVFDDTVDDEVPDT